MKIDLENHFATESWLDALVNNEGDRRLEDESERRSPEAWSAIAKKAELLDIGEGRIKAMDAAGVDFAYLSQASPGVEAFDPVLGAKLAEDVNDTLAEATLKHPNRLGGYATIAPKNVGHAVKELERCVKDLGFKGWHTHSNYGDSYLDAPEYWPVLAKAEELNIPIYLHPAIPIIPQIREFGFVLAGPSFGFGVEVAYVFMRMIVRGVFDAFPRLKIIMGHYGEALPFLVNRVDTAHRQGKGAPHAEIGPGSKLLPSEYVKNNLWVTNSGNYFAPAYCCARDGLGLDRLLLGSDFPYEKMRTSVDFLADLGLPDEELNAVYEVNARALGF